MEHQVRAVDAIRIGREFFGVVADTVRRRHEKHSGGTDSRHRLSIMAGKTQHALDVTSRVRRLPAQLLS